MISPAAFMLALCFTARVISSEPIKNLALNQMAFQKTTYNSMAASLAVDGIKKTEANSGYCAKTKEGLDEYWSVRLKDAFRVESVQITASNEGPLSELNIFVGAYKETAVPAWRGAMCKVSISVTQGFTKLFRCDRFLDGQYVSIIPSDQTKKRHLVLCEVAVFGYKLPDVRIQEGRVYRFHHELVNATEAVSGCTGTYTRLATIRSVSQRQLVYNTMYERKMDSAWVAEDDEAVGRGSCVMLQGNISYYSQECNHKRSFVCQAGSIATETRAGKQYNIYQVKVNWYQAKQVCMTSASRLVFVTDDLQPFVLQIVIKHKLEEVWIEKVLGKCPTLKKDNQTTVKAECTRQLAFLCESDTPTTQPMSTAAVLEPQQSKVPAAAIAVPVVLIVIIAVLAVVFVFVVKKRKEKQRNVPDPATVEYEVPTMEYSNNAYSELNNYYSTRIGNGTTEGNNQQTVPNGTGGPHIDYEDVHVGEQ